MLSGLMCKHAGNPTGYVAGNMLILIYTDFMPVDLYALELDNWETY